MAKQALLDAFKSEEKHLSEKEKTEQALSISHEKWKAHLFEDAIITEHMKYYADDLISHEVQLEAATVKYDQAVLDTEQKIGSFKICDSIAEKTKEIHTKLRRQIIQKKEERALSAFEERFAYLWGRKL